MRKNTNACNLILITGASSGIGKAVAEEAAKNLYKVVLWGRNLQRLKATAKNCEKNYKGSVVGIISEDLTNVHLIKNQIENFTHKYGKYPNILIHCAGSSPSGTIEKLDIQSAADVITLNTTTLISLSSALLPMMRKTGGGHILCITSGHALIGTRNFSAYSAAKSGMERILESIEQEENSKYIAVTKVSPGLVDTPQTNSQTNKNSNVRKRKAKKMISPEKVSKAVFKSIDQKKNITLTNINKIAPLVAFCFPSIIHRAFNRK